MDELHMLELEQEELEIMRALDFLLERQSLPEGATSKVLQLFLKIGTPVFRDNIPMVA